MGLRFVVDKYRGRVALFDSVSGYAFGPVFEGEDAEEQADSFCNYVERHAEQDARTIKPVLLQKMHEAWRQEWQEVNA